MEEGCLVPAVKALRHLSGSQIKKVLKTESRNLEITKSLLNILHNIVNSGYIRIGYRKRKFFEDYTQTVLFLTSKKVSIVQKKKILLKNVAIISAIANTCLSIAG